MNPIYSVVRSMNRHLSEIWEAILQEHAAELSSMFAEFGDRAYGVYIQQLMGPICEEVRKSGYEVSAGFRLSESVENWGPPEERERCVWYVVRDETGNPCGTAVLQIFHSHAQFHLPQPPRFLALEETEQEAILQALCTTGVRLSGLPLRYRHSAGDEPLEWEYGTDAGLLEYVQSYRGHTAVDFNYALSSWGRHGWELVQIVPHQDRLIGFFKRPVQQAGEGQ
ncbi:DUF6022 family protein [Paenibacillus sp. VMFN-D1]|uniref:DUF6022 family protein n=1 Tax=Paenibacillus sp. VMFN-D1 TaxID=2135608 RepID=UPI000E22E1AC|nr:DUF6022 family protein [Paenibacillus sp. VMFN-D1]RED34645.1 hypothetical protein C7820_4307 [Paenibacillus sp. VMFN-D1]